MQRMSLAADTRLGSASSVVDLVGRTALIPLRRVTASASGVEIYAKAEFQNPGGSVKDRAAVRIILDAERSGQLRPGGTILDATSGNTGIAYAMLAAARGYRVTLCVPASVTEERVHTLRAYGAEIILTSGTFVGVGRRLREHSSGIRLISVQPDSAVHAIEGLKDMETAIVPGIYDSGLADENLRVSTEEAWELTRRLAREEGLLVGVSSGAALAAALAVASRLRKGVIVTVFPDSGTRYLSEPFWRGV
jgi:S-sulfo-L-cysteine synthase (O-acetyl-L-serine-dependent)